MLYIDKIWQDYFENHHEGLGTTYERFILHDYFKKIHERYNVTSVLESPSFGMTGVSGINSLWWAFNGFDVTVCDSDMKREKKIWDVWKEVKADVNIVHVDDYSRLPFDDNSFDLGWNFASLLFVDSLEDCLRELVRVSKKAVFICVPNTLNVFHLLRSLSDSNTGQNINNIKHKRIRSVLTSLNWTIVENGFLDVPPWPDIAMKKEDLLRKFGLKKKDDGIKDGEGECLCILDYFSGKNMEMEKEILKYNFLENSPRIIKSLWGHHRYYICEPEITAEERL